MFHMLQLLNDSNDHDSKYSIFTIKLYSLTMLDNKVYQRTLPSNNDWNAEWSITRCNKLTEYVGFKLNEIVDCQIDDDFVWLIE